MRAVTCSVTRGGPAGEGNQENGTAGVLPLKTVSGIAVVSMALQSMVAPPNCTMGLTRSHISTEEDK